MQHARSKHIIEAYGSEKVHSRQCLLRAKGFPNGHQTAAYHAAAKAVTQPTTSRRAREAGPQIRKMVCVKKCINSAAAAASCVGL